MYCKSCKAEHVCKGYCSWMWIPKPNGQGTIYAEGRRTRYNDSYEALRHNCRECDERFFLIEKEQIVIAQQKYVDGRFPERFKRMIFGWKHNGKTATKK